MESVDMTFELSIWTVYRFPSDYPDKWVAREWFISKGEVRPTPNIVLANDLAAIRDEMSRRHLTYLPRYEADDPAIFECWV